MFEVENLRTFLIELIKPECSQKYYFELANVYFDNLFCCHYQRNIKTL